MTRPSARKTMRSASQSSAASASSRSRPEAPRVLEAGSPTAAAEATTTTGPEPTLTRAHPDAAQQLFGAADDTGCAPLDDTSGAAGGAQGLHADARGPRGKRARVEQPQTSGATRGQQHGLLDDSGGDDDTDGAAAAGATTRAQGGDGDALGTSNASPAPPTPTCSPFPCPAIRSPRPRATSR